jgi:hypothetical protein
VSRLGAYFKFWREGENDNGVIIDGAMAICVVAALFAWSGGMPFSINSDDRNEGTRMSAWNRENPDPYIVGCMRFLTTLRFAVNILV